MFFEDIILLLGLQYVFYIFSILFGDFFSVYVFNVLFNFYIISLKCFSINDQVDINVYRVQCYFINFGCCFKDYFIKIIFMEMSVKYGDVVEVRRSQQYGVCDRFNILLGYF